MIIHKNNYILDIDCDAARSYSQSHTLCDCCECRNLHVQAREKLPELAAFLDEMGILIERPDETGSHAANGKINYDFVAYTVPGRILEYDPYEIDLRDGGQYLSIVINGEYVPNEQKTADYFTVSVYNISLPWVLNEPFPGKIEIRPSLFSRIKEWFKRA